MRRCEFFARGTAAALTPAQRLKMCAVGTRGNSRQWYGPSWLYVGDGHGGVRFISHAQLVPEDDAFYDVAPHSLIGRVDLYVAGVCVCLCVCVCMRHIVAKTVLFYMRSAHVFAGHTRGGANC